MKKYIGLFIVGVLLLFIAGCGKVASESDSSGGDGRGSTPGLKILYYEEGLDGKRLCTVKIDGTEKKVLTNFGNITGYSYSSDSSKIAYALNKNLYKINSDGTNLIQLTNTPTSDFMPCWSPDDSKIAYCSWEDGAQGIYVINSDGTNKLKIATGGLTIWGRKNSVWSPDGMNILYTVSNSLYKIGPDGSNNTLVTSLADGTNNFPIWSPDGNKIAYIDAGDVFIINNNGSNKINLTNNSYSCSTPYWTPSGDKIVYDLYNGAGSNSGIYIINSDGSNNTRLTYNSSDSFPIVSPDGTKIVYAAYSGNPEIFIMNIDGSNTANITNSS